MMAKWKIWSRTHRNLHSSYFKGWILRKLLKNHEALKRFLGWSCGEIKQGFSDWEENICQFWAEQMFSDTHSWLRVRRLWRGHLEAVAGGQRTDPSMKSMDQCLQDCAWHSLGQEVKNPEDNNGNNKPGCCPCPCPQWCPVPFPADPKALHRGHRGQDSPLPLPPGSFSIPAPWNAGRESAQIWIHFHPYQLWKMQKRENCWEALCLQPPRGLGEDMLVNACWNISF